MHSVESIAAEIVRREGGFVNDPDDPGGATNHGVTLATLRGLKADLTGDGRVDVADVKALTRRRRRRSTSATTFARRRSTSCPSRCRRASSTCR